MKQKQNLVIHYHKSDVKTSQSEQLNPIFPAVLTANAEALNILFTYPLNSNLKKNAETRNPPKALVLKHKELF